MKVERASVNLANTVGILSSASPFNLYQISKKNGLNYNWSEFSGEYGSLNKGDATGKLIPSGTGSLLVLKPSEDFGLQDSEASGLSGAFNFQVSLTVKCIDPGQTVGTPDYELFVIVINEGAVSIDVAGTGSTVTNIGCVSEADVLKAETRPNLDYNQMKGLIGGDFIDSLTNWAKKGANVAHNVAKYAPLVSDGLKSIGMGRGGELVGSAIAHKKSLKDRLK